MLVALLGRKYKLHNMKSLIILIFVLAPILLFSQASISELRDGRDLYVTKSVYFTDSLGNKLINVEMYIDNVDYLVLADSRLSSLELEDDGKGFFLLLCDGKKLFLVKTYHRFDTPRDISRRVLNKGPRYDTYFRVRGVTSINGVNVLVDDFTPEDLFKTIKKGHHFIDKEIIPDLDYYGYIELEKTLPKPTIIAIIDL